MNYEEQLNHIVGLRSKIAIYCAELASLLYIPICVTTSDKPISTDGKRLYFGQPFFDMPTREQIHQMMRMFLHVILNHIERGNGVAITQREQKVWADATEMITNQALLRTDWMTAPKDALYFDQVIPEEKRRDMPPINDMSAPQLFRALQEYGYGPSSKPIALLMVPGQSDDMKDQTVASRGDLDSELDQAKSETAEKIEREMNRIQLSDIMAGLGSESFLMQLLADIPPPPRTPWELELKSLMIGPLTSHYKANWSTPSRRVTSGGLPKNVFVPAYQKSTGLKQCLVDMDLSGSCFNPELITRWAHEIASIQQQTGCEVIFRTFDTQIHNVQKVTNDRVSFVDKVQNEFIKLEGGGGTDFRPLFEPVYKDSEGVEYRLDDIAVQIILTDLEGPAPSTPPKHMVIWVGMDGEISKDVPFGKLIELF